MSSVLLNISFLVNCHISIVSFFVFFVLYKIEIKFSLSFLLVLSSSDQNLTGSAQIWSEPLRIWSDLPLRIWSDLVGDSKVLHTGHLICIQVAPNHQNCKSIVISDSWKVACLGCTYWRRVSCCYTAWMFVIWMDSMTLILQSNQCYSKCTMTCNFFWNRDYNLVWQCFLASDNDCHKWHVTRGPFLQT